MEGRYPKKNHSSCVKLLGVYLDNTLSFNSRVMTVCKKAGRQLNAMCRVSHFLSKYSLINVHTSFIISGMASICGAGHIFTN